MANLKGKGGNKAVFCRLFLTIVLIKDNSMVTYIMNPTEKMNELNC
jgi:hypothetical protein